MEFNAWLIRNLGPLTLFAGVLTGNRQDGHDVLADALIKVSDRWDQISQMTYPAAYVRKVVVSTFLSEQRTTRHRTTAPMSDPTGSDHRHTSIDIADHIAAKDETERLLADLPPRQRAAVVLRYYLDYDDTTTADALGTSVSTVRSSISRALTSLRVADHHLNPEPR